MTIRAYDFNTYNDARTSSSTPRHGRLDRDAPEFIPNTDRYAIRITGASVLSDRDRDRFASGNSAAIDLFAKFSERLTSEDSRVRDEEWNALRAIVTEGIACNHRNSPQYIKAARDEIRRKAIGNIALSDQQLDAVTKWQIVRAATAEAAVDAGFDARSVDNAIARYETSELNSAAGLTHTQSAVTSPALLEFLQDYQFPARIVDNRTLIDSMSLSDSINNIYQASANIADAATINPDISDAQYADPEFDALTNIGDEDRDLTPEESDAITAREQNLAENDATEYLTPEQRVQIVRSILENTRPAPELPIEGEINHAFVMASSLREDLLEAVAAHGILAPEYSAVVDALDRAAFNITPELPMLIAPMVETLAATPEFAAYKEAANSYASNLYDANNNAEKSDPTHVPPPSSFHDAHKQFIYDMAEGRKDPIARVDVIAQTVREAQIAVELIKFAASYGPKTPKIEETKKILATIRERMSRTIIVRTPTPLLLSTPKSIFTKTGAQQRDQMKLTQDYFAAIIANPGVAPTVPDMSATISQEARMHPYWEQFLNGQNVAARELDAAGNPVELNPEEPRKLLTLATTKVTQRALFGPESHTLNHPVLALYGTAFYNNTAAIEREIKAVTDANRSWKRDVIGEEVLAAKPKTTIVIAADPAANNPKSASRSTAAFLATAKQENMTVINMFVKMNDHVANNVDSRTGQVSTQRLRYISFEDAMGRNLTEFIDPHGFNATGKSLLKGYRTKKDGTTIFPKEAGTLIVLHPGGNLKVNAANPNDADHDRARRALLRSAMTVIANKTIICGLNAYDAGAAHMARKTLQTFKDCTVLNDAGHPMALEEVAALAKSTARLRRDGYRQSLETFDIAAAIGPEKISSLTGRLFLSQLTNHRTGNKIADALSADPKKEPTIQDITELATSNLPELARLARKNAATPEQLETIGVAKLVGGPTLEALRDNRSYNAAIANAFHAAQTTQKTTIDFNGFPVENAPYRGEYHTIETTGALANAAGKPVVLSIKPDLSEKARTALTTPSTAIIGSLSPATLTPEALEKTTSWIDKAVEAAAKSGVGISTTADDVGAYVVTAAEKYGARVLVVGNSPEIAFATTRVNKTDSDKENDVSIPARTQADLATDAFERLKVAGKAAYVTPNMGVEKDAVAMIEDSIPRAMRNVAESKTAIEKIAENRLAAKKLLAATEEKFSNALSSQPRKLRNEFETLPPQLVGEPAKVVEIFMQMKSDEKAAYFDAYPGANQKAVLEIEKEIPSLKQSLTEINADYSETSKLYKGDTKALDNLINMRKAITIKAGVTDNHTMARISELELAVSPAKAVLVVACPREPNPVHIVAEKAARDPRIEASGGKKVAAVYLPGSEHAGSRLLASSNGHVNLKVGRSGSDTPRAAVRFVDQEGKTDQDAKTFSDKIATTPNYRIANWSVAPATPILNEKHLDAFIAKSTETSKVRSTPLALTGADIAIMTGAARAPNKYEVNEARGREFIDQRKAEYDADAWKTLLSSDNFGVSQSAIQKHTVADITR